MLDCTATYFLIASLGMHSTLPSVQTQALTEATLRLMDDMHSTRSITLVSGFNLFCIESCWGFALVLSGWQHAVPDTVRTVSGMLS